MSLPPYVGITTDFGAAYTGICAGVVARIAPHARIQVLSDEVSKYAVVEGALLLEQALPHLPVGVHLAVVDPGVGTPRHPIAVRTGRGDFLVGPDNGLLVPAAEALGGVAEARILENPELRLPSLSSTFHGRDVFAPVAARLAGGAPLSGAGTSIEPASLVRLPEPVVMVGDGYLEAEVTAVDRFGNVQLAATGTSLDALDEHLLVGGVHAVRGGTFADAPPGELIVFVDSAERVAVAINGGRAVVALSVSPGDVLRIDNA